MREAEKILAHHAGARLYHHRTGRFPSSEELARLVQAGGQLGELAAYNSPGCVDTARAVLTGQEDLHCDLGDLYQRLRESREKKGLGQVFTPGAAVQSALALLGPISPARIIDPACGAGEFLIHGAEVWPNAELVGIDIDSLALAIARTRLTLAGAEKVMLVQENALRLGEDGDYDLVLGNPPWGSVVSRKEVKGFSISPGRLLNSFVYFLEIAARLLKPGGNMAMVLPEAFIKVWTYQGAREWFLQNFSITGLHYIPSLFTGYYAPAMLLAAVRLPAERPKKIPVWYQRGLNWDKLKYNSLPAEAVKGERFNLNWQRDMEALWTKCCQRAVFLQEGNLGAPLPPGEVVVDFSLGIVTGGNQRFLSHQPRPGHLPILTARDVTPFAVQAASRWLKFDQTKLQQAAPVEKYQVPAKIVYKFIAREIIAAIDYSCSLTLNNLNFIIPLRLPFSLEYLTALLNSRLLNTLYMYKFFTGKVLTRHLKQLPLVVGTQKEQVQIAALAGKEERLALEERIYALYGLKRAEIDLIDQQYRKLREVFFV